jgi:hypothetical protein
MNSIVEEGVDSCSTRNFTEHPRLFALYPKLNDAVRARHNWGIRGRSASDR